MKITKKLEEKIRKQPKVYITACWARWGIQEFYWTGKWYIDDIGRPQPIVYFYNDHNGAYEEYQTIPITYTTTGTCADWSFYKSMAQHLADKLNELDNVIK